LVAAPDLPSGGTPTVLGQGPRVLLASVIERTLTYSILDTSSFFGESVLARLEKTGEQSITSEVVKFLQYIIDF
jgi:hypothetical protein